LTTQGKKEAWPREKERTVAREKEKGGVKGRKQWQRGERNGKGEKLMAHEDKKQGKKDG